MCWLLAEMLDEILAFAKMAGQVEEGEEELLSLLCQVAERELASKLKNGVKPEDCAGAFVIAAAWLALSLLCVSRQEDRVESWSVGEVSVKRGADAAEQAAVYRGQAERLMQPYCEDDGFAFIGVRG